MKLIIANRGAHDIGKTTAIKNVFANLYAKYAIPPQKKKQKIPQTRKKKKMKILIKEKCKNQIQFLGLTSPLFQTKSTKS